MMGWVVPVSNGMHQYDRWYVVCTSMQQYDRRYVVCAGPPVG